MKKTISSLIAATVLSAIFVIPAHASEDFDTKVDRTETTNYTDSSGLNVQDTTYYNKDGEVIEVTSEKDQSATYSTDEVIPMAASSGVYTAHSKSSVSARAESGFKQLRIYANGFSDSYTSKAKTNKKSIDKITVNTSLVMNGSVEAQNSDNRTNSSFANTSAKQKKEMIPTSAQYSRSSHSYQNKGATSIYHSTEAKR